MLGIVFGLYFCTTLLLNIPYVQRQASSLVASELSDLLQSKVSIERIDMGLMNRIIIDNLSLQDRKKEEMLKVTRLAARFDVLPLFQGKISIRNVQLFGFQIRLNRETPDTPPNFQFVVDAFAPKDTLKQKKELDLRINSLLIRRGKLSYDVLSEAETPGHFNPHHIRLHNIIANISLKALSNDSINANIKRFSVDEEHSGFSLKKLSMKAVGGSKDMHISNFVIGLPRTELQMDTIRVTYDSLASFTRFASDVHFNFRLKPSRVILQDVASLVPAFSPFSEPLMLETEANGTADRLNCPRFSLSWGNHFRLRGDVILNHLSNPARASVSGKLSTLHADPEGVAFLVRNLSRERGDVPPMLQRLGTVSFRGDLSGRFSDLHAHGDVHTDLGSVNTNLHINTNREKGRFAYKGDVRTTDFELGRLINDKKLGRITFNLDVDSHHAANELPTMNLKGLVSTLHYSDYTYRNITLDGEYRQGGFYGNLHLDDPNGTVQINGIINTTTHTPTFNFRAEVSQLRPQALHLLADYDDAALSVKVNANFTGGSIDHMNGEISIDSLLYDSPQQQYLMRNFKVTAHNHEGKEKRLNIASDFLRGNIQGNYSYRTLPSTMLNILHHYVPALAPQITAQQLKIPGNNFSFDLHLYDTELISTVFRLPLTVYMHSSLRGYINDHTKRLHIEGYFPEFRYKNRFVRAASLLCENPANQLHTRIRFNEIKENSTLNIAMDAMAENDSIKATVNWGNSSIETYSGKVSALAHFVRALPDEETDAPRITQAPLKTVVDVLPTQVILNDTIWQLEASRVVVDSGKVHINDFAFTHNDRHVRINGTLSSQPEDTVRLDLNKINVGYVFDVVNLNADFSGEATGPAYASSVLGEPVANTDLFFRDLSFNGGLLGDARIHGEWHHNVKGIYLEADIREKEIARSRAKGYIYPLKPSAIDLQIEADSTNLQFLHYYISELTPQFSGRASGNVHLYGKFKELTMEGKVRGDASLKVDVLNTTYTVSDSILIRPDGLTFSNNRLTDRHGHRGRVSGYLNYEHFKNMAYRFDFNYDNMLLLDTRESPDYPFYGTVFGTGTARVEGDERNGLNITVGMTSQRHSAFTYIKDYVSTAVSNQFIRFVDKTPRRAIQDSVRLSDFEIARQQMREEQEEESEMDIRLNIQVDATPDATLRIIMDPVAEDDISARGTGSIRMDYYNKGDVRMFGSYNINQGVYKFSLQELIRKDFVIQDGSTISFNGLPENASLDINATYTVNSASLNDLMPTEALGDDLGQTNVKVNCLMSLDGDLTAPTLSFNLELPNEREEVQALVRNYIPTDEQMNMQILYLLAIGKFYTQENMGATQNSNVMSSVVSSTLSGQLNNALSNILNMNNWNIGTNFSTGEKGWTDMEFETMLSGQLLNNRLIINGNFGYRDNPMANTNFIGDFEAEWLVTRSGDIRLKAYNETNDRYYTRTNLTTQGIGIIFKKDFDWWNELFFWRKWKKKKD